MKIVLIGPAYPLRGGNALFLAHLYEALAASNDVQVISFSRLYPGFLFPGVRQTDMSRIALKKHPAQHVIDCLNPITWWKAGRLVASLKPDILAFTWWNPFFGPILRIVTWTYKRLARGAVLGIVENVISHEGRWIDLLLTKAGLGLADRFLVLSSAVETDIRKLYPAVKVFRSSLPIYDCYQVGEVLDQVQAQEKLGLAGKNIVLFFGYIRKYKGLMNLIEAFPAIRQEVSNAHLLVVGEFYDNPQPYYDAIRKIGLQSAVTIVAEYVPNEEVQVYFSAANVNVLPYNHATQSGILSIAYGFAKPVIVTDVGGLSELVENGATGYVVPPHDKNALAESVIRYFNEKKENEFSSRIISRRAENSFNRIREVFLDIRNDLAG